MQKNRRDKIINNNSNNNREKYKYYWKRSHSQEYLQYVYMLCGHFVYVCFCFFMSHGQRASTCNQEVTNPSYCNVAILPAATKDLPISPRFSSTSFYRDASSALLHLVNQWLNFTYTHVLTLSATDARYKFLVPVAPVAQRYHVTSDTLGREFDPGKRYFSR